MNYDVVIYVHVPMENLNRETTASIPTATPAPLSVTATTVPAGDVDPNECCETKHKFYKRHFLALSDRCEIIQQVKLPTVARAIRQTVFVNSPYLEWPMTVLTSHLHSGDVTTPCDPADDIKIIVLRLLLFTLVRRMTVQTVLLPSLYRERTLFFIFHGPDFVTVIGPLVSFVRPP